MRETLLHPQPTSKTPTATSHRALTASLVQSSRLKKLFTAVLCDVYNPIKYLCVSWSFQLSCFKVFMLLFLHRNLKIIYTSFNIAASRKITK